ncbi:DUF5302 family protein [Streptomyces sp. NPDC047525]|uniref:DUF5302 family protein n=1 Tax=Streptomyces sp. NPDC047525 TaxID=3155264 RepID=UPI0033C6AD74
MSLVQVNRHTTPARGHPRAHEPIAIVGIGCRLPGGVDTPATLWQALLDGADRGALGTTPTGRGAFLDDIDGFDADLFRIPPAEARHMDPRQRIALETAWASLEDARIVHDSLPGSRTGVFMATTGPHRAARRDTSTVAARIARALGLTGHAPVVATAGGSSLTAAHLAVRSLRDAEVDLALAGGVHVVLDPHAVDAAAGHVRGEGCGVLVLRRLSDALAAGDRVYAVIRGSAVGHDGVADVMRAAWQDAGTGPGQVSYVEAHGCGTCPGGPVEAEALGTVFTDAARTQALLIGSGTADFGHLEAAAGVVGLMKTALALHHGELPADRQVTAPDPLTGTGTGTSRLEAATARTPWPGDARRYAGVGGFGPGGAHAHLALEEAPHRRRLFVPLAADSADDLRAAADELTGRSRADGAWYAPELLGRAPGTHRVVAAVTHSGELAGALRTQVAAHTRDRAVTPDALAFCFSDRGSQWPGMGRTLLGDPAFRAALDACDRALRPFTGWSVTAELLADPVTSRLGRTDVAQPVLFALQTALARTLRAWGVEPAVVLGQGTGEVAAAVFAHALPLAEGARLIVALSRLDAEHAHGARELRQTLGALRGRPTAVPFWSTVTGGYVEGTDLDAAYWARSRCAGPRLIEAARELAGGRRLRVVEITPHPVAHHTLQHGLDTVDGLGADQPRVLSTGHRDREARQALEDVAATLWCDGFAVDFGAVTGRRPRRTAPGPVVLTVSGRTARARAENAARLASLLDGTLDAGLLDVAYTAARHRPHLEHRASVVAASSAEAAQALRALADGRGHPCLVAGTAAAGTDLAVLFTGQGGQRVGMGRELYAAFPEFRRALDEVCAALDPYLRLPLVAVLFAAHDGPDAALIHEPEFAQPALFAVDVALFRLWTSWGVAPAAVAGHGVGEVAAAHAAGGLDLADAARLVTARGRWTQAGEPGAEEFVRAVTQCVFREPSTAWVSTVTGGAVTAGEVADPRYWMRQVREDVRFVDAVRTLERSGVGRYVECGPAGPLSTVGASCVRAPAVFVASQRATPGTDEPVHEVRDLVRALGALHVAGQDIAWERVFSTGVPVDLPTYAFQRERRSTERPAPIVTVVMPCNSGRAVPYGEENRMTETPQSNRNEDENTGTGADAVRAKFKAALERKSQASRAKQAHEEGRAKVKNMNNPAGQKRNFRRKTG